jgi:hypothetical protein
MSNNKPMPACPADDAALLEKIDWLLQTHGYCELLDKVVKLYEASDECLLAPLAFARSRRAWHQATTGKRGGLKIIYASSIWEMHATRPNIQGIRMRPDMPFPTYRENGGLFKNTYRRPAHEGDGDVRPFLKFMERFLPHAREREWQLDWMAHKQAHPEIPGTAVLFVADTDDGVREGKFGTGRGMFFKVMHKLYGEQYSRSQSFNILDGTSSQSTYNDWMHNSVLVTVDEAKSSPTSYRRGERSAVYEVLKDLVDPAPKQHNFKVKFGRWFDGMSYCSFMVACNHADAIAIPAHDRRFTVLTNGRVMTVEEENEFAAWMTDPGNIAALSRFLAARDLSAFNMFHPLDTVAKQDMAELALTQVEGILRDLMEDDKQELVFTRYQLEQQVADILGGGSRYNTIGIGQWRGEFESAWKAYCVLLKTKNKSPSRVRVCGQLAKLYCFRTRKKQVEKLPEAARQASARRRGGVDAAKLAEASNKLKKGENQHGAGDTYTNTE